jgi:prepilin-type N-terminal cleavage/methylation domain-containing protein
MEFMPRRLHGGSPHGKDALSAPTMENADNRTIAELHMANMKIRTGRPQPVPARQLGFTLVELLVVITIIVALAAIGFLGYSKFIEKGRKVQALAMMRDFESGMAMFITDYTKPPIPRSKRDTGWDTIYGDPGGNYSTQFLVAALAGEDKDYPYKDESFSSKDANPRQESYMVFKPAENGRAGVSKDGKLMDPWGRELMVAINGLASPGASLVDFNSGQNDRRLHTWGLAEYSDTKPRDQDYVLWSYGKDGNKGDGSPNTAYAGTDDVVSW